MINANIYHKHENISNIYQKHENTSSQHKVCANHNETIELINSIIGVVIPFILMFIANVIIIKTIFKSRKNTISTLNNNNVLLRDIKFSITSISLNVSFFILNMPLSIYLVLKILIEVEEITDLNITISLSIIYYTHYGTLFYVSYLINSAFRNEFHNLIRDIRLKFVFK